MCGPGPVARDVEIRKLLSQPCRNATPLGKDTAGVCWSWLALTLNQLCSPLPSPKFRDVPPVA